MLPTEFIDLVKPAALENFKRYGVLPSITIAQAALESGWGVFIMPRAGVLISRKKGGPKSVGVY